MKPNHRGAPVRAMLVLVLAMLNPAVAQDALVMPSALSGPVLVEAFDPQFPHADGNYHSLTVASDGQVYFSLCTHHIDGSAKLFRFDPQTSKLRDLGDMDRVLDLPRGHILQGKIHTPLLEHDGRLYFATHCSVYRETVPDPAPPGGRKPYPGGCLVSYELKTRRFTRLAQAPPSEGLISLQLDRRHQTLIALSWPGGLLFSYAIKTGQWQCLGAVQGQGEWDADPATRQNICRSLGAAPQGGIYLSDRAGSIWSVDVSQLRPVRRLRDVSLASLPQFQGPQPDVHQWRTLDWNERSGSFLGLQWRSGVLFAFQLGSESAPPSVRALARFGSPQQFLGMPLAAAIDAQGRFYALVSYPAQPMQGRKSFDSQAHLVSYDASRSEAVDHGPLVTRDGAWRVIGCESLAIADDGTLYAVGAVEKPLTDPPAKLPFTYMLLRLPAPVLQH